MVYLLPFSIIKGKDVVMNIAITVEGNNVSQQFDCADNFLILTAEDGEVHVIDKINFENDSPFTKISKLAALDIDILLCGAIKKHLIEQLEYKGITVFPMMIGEVRYVLERFFINRIPYANLSDIQIG